MLKEIALYIVFAPLLGAILTGLTVNNKSIDKSFAHWITCSLVGISAALSFYAIYYILSNDITRINFTLYNWITVGSLNLEVGFLIDRLTAIMMATVTFVSLMVHIYTIGYMDSDPGYKRFFSYISLFTFMMLMLVMSNNFVQLFFGWEGVGLVSYLLIGFWFKKETAIFANLKAFLVNRVGDLGFVLGIAVIYLYCGSLNYDAVFPQINNILEQSMNITIIPNLYSIDVNIITLICCSLFIGAMAKSAQVPLHVWLPDSMEGPTPISALIHAATMVTAGVFMVARMSPIFEYSEVARSFILVIGGTTALFMGILGIVQSDIKRIIAYSTLSQLGYMVVALGASAYSIAIFHLFTHAFFKALLFLAAGSVIIAMHHEQNIWKMGNLKKYMPITYWVSLAGSLALIAFPFTSGFYSKDLIIEAVKEISIPGSVYAYYCVLISVFVTALYTFRLFFVVFHTTERMDEHTKSNLKESPMVVWLPLVLLAIPSLFIGAICIKNFIFVDEQISFFRKGIFVLTNNDVIKNHMFYNFTSWFGMAVGSVMHEPFWLAMSGVLVAFVFYVLKPNWPVVLAHRIKLLYVILTNKYGFDSFNELVLAKSTRSLSKFTADKVDMGLIDQVIVNGSAYGINKFSIILRKAQKGFLYNYIFLMIFGLLSLLLYLIFFN